MQGKELTERLERDLEEIEADYQGAAELWEEKEEALWEYIHHLGGDQADFIEFMLK